MSEPKKTPDTAPGKDADKAQHATGAEVEHATHSEDLPRLGVEGEQGGTARATCECGWSYDVRYLRDRFREDALREVRSAGRQHTVGASQ
jgi:hypothetical protein